MFRLIAAALVSAYALLALTGSEQHTVTQQAGMMAITRRPAPTLQVGSNYLVTAPVGLRNEAHDNAAALAHLTAGAPVLVLSSAPQGYARVRDDAGRTGYVPAAVLSEAL